MKQWLLLGLVISLTAQVSAGDIRGMVSISGTADNSGVVMYVEKQPDMDFSQPEKQPVMDQKNLQFMPHILPVQVGTTVLFKNSDDVEHNIFTPSPAGDMFNLGTWRGGQTKTHTFQKTGEVVLLCNLHPEMEAFIYVTPTPYYAKTNNGGKYIIEGVPAGTYTLHLWSEQGNARPQKITVPEDGSVSANFTVK